MDTLGLNGMIFRTFVAAPYLGKEVEINGKTVTFNYDYDKNVIWMEGIGGGNLPLRPLDWKETGTGEVFKSCSLYGVTLAEYGDRSTKP